MPPFLAVPDFLILPAVWFTSGHPSESLILNQFSGETIFLAYLSQKDLIPIQREDLFANCSLLISNVKECMEPQ